MADATDIISLPKGGGAVQGIGEKFSPDLFTGTGNFTVPIALPPGRNGFKPEINLVYSTGTGNGPFGLGWALSVPGVSRKTSKGVPRYNDSTDVFLLSGSEDLVPIAPSPAGPIQYRPRTEGLFAQILHYSAAPDNYWQVTTKDGLTSLYGTKASAGNDPAVIADPAVNVQSKPFAWKLTQTSDPFGNLIRYTYARDQSNTGVHQWDQLYLSTIQYADYGTDPTNPSFLVTVQFRYTPRPDHFSDYRAGFEIRTVQRCTRIDILAGAGGNTPVRTYYLDYVDPLPLNGSSLLHRIRVEGHDGANSQWLPPLEFGYTQFTPKEQQFFPLTGSVPVTSLTDTSLEVIDLFGNGLPDILQMNGTTRYWRNQGAGKFALPHYMDEAPLGLQLSDSGVQILDANGDGRADLLVTTPRLSGYFPLQFDGLWDKRSFQRYQKAPSFNLKDPEVRLVDLDGDGVTDAVRSSTQMEYYFNDALKGWTHQTRAPRQQLAEFPNVDFSDPRVKCADMNGDGLQDVVFVHNSLIEYWPSLGRGNWGKRIDMSADPSLHFHYGYDPKRVLLGDVDGDGRADLIYVDNGKVTLWINQGGNGWGPAITISGTPPVSDLDSMRLVDLLGNGVAGLLWSANANGNGRANYFFLDFTGGVKPYLLNHMNNHVGAITDVEYKPSTWFYLQDVQRLDTGWITPLPFPVQVVAGVTVTDEFSQGTLTTEYSYHHGYWEGFEREFRGFGRVDQRDTQVFDLPYFSPPTETRTWFHQGDIGDAYSGWRESDTEDGFATEYFSEPWPGLKTAAAQVLSRPPSVAKYLCGLDPSVKRDAFRSMRGKILRTELYALDRTARQNLPYTVTEHVYAARQEAPASGANPPVFFPFLLSERTTRWERGSDPLTRFKFSDNCDSTGQPLDYDAYGQVLSQINVAVPRGRTFQAPGSGPPYHATQAVTTYAHPTVVQSHIVDRATSVTSYEVENDGTLSVFALVQQIRGQIQGHPVTKNPIGHTLNFYDGAAFHGLPFGQIGSYGALVRTDNLVLTSDVLGVVYGTSPPPYIITDGAPTWTSDYPQEFQSLLPPCAGYAYQKAQPGSAYQTGYYRSTILRKYDFQDGAANARGLLLAKQDPLDHQTTITYDAYGLFPATVKDAAGLTTEATYDYRVFQPVLVTDPNGNQSQYGFSPLGLLDNIAVMGQPAQNLGDTTASPGTVFAYTFFDPAGTPVADLAPPQPISVETTCRVYHVNQTSVPEPQRNQTIVKIEYSDGFGRVLQTRTQAEDTLFGDPVFGDTVLPANQSDTAGTGADVAGRQRGAADPPNVVASGWQNYDNKGQIVEKYEPFFSTGWAYARPGDAQTGQKATLYYDALGRLIRTVNPDGSEQRVVYGVPGTIATPDFSNPDVYEPTPWEAYTYDPDDNAGRTDPAGSTAYQYQYNTPSNIVIDALGRTVLAVQHNRNQQADGSWSGIVEYNTASTYDIRGNLLTVVDTLGRTAFTHAYDLANRALLTTSIDGGDRRSVLDAANNLVEQRDTKTALILHSYDALNRAIRLWARDMSGQMVGLRERIIYGDDSSGSGLTQAQAVASNLLGKPYKNYDEAGLLRFASYDFKGNLLASTRSVIAESALLAVFDAPPANWVLTPFLVDWGAANPPPLDTKTYESTSAYDALNRIMTMQYPQSVDGARKLLTPQYNNAGALEKLQLDGVTYVDRIAYNAKGQRVLITYGNGNGQMTRYAYDPQTFRLLRMRTESYTKPSASTYHPSAPVAPLQDFGYVYDLVGNVLALYDSTPGSGIQNTALGTDALNRSFVYDPVYRLISATGRECDMPPPPPPWTDAPRCADITKARSYTETYQYDNVGNMALWGHTSTDTAGSPSTTNREFALVSGNNRLEQLTVGATAYQYAYDATGNLVQENTERHFEWDESDRMRVFRIQPDRAPPSIYTQYLYDSGGQRVMKLTRNQAGGYETTVYIGGIFEERRNVSGATRIENSLVHVIDDKSRVAIVRVGPALPGDGAADVPVQYHFGDHLGSSNVVVSDTGAWVNREEYLPYGETSFGSFARKRYRFTGKERDEESGLNYHGARYYAPWLSRWVSCDPRGPIDSVNLYAYTVDEPVSSRDPTGFQSEDSLSTSRGNDLPSTTGLSINDQDKVEVRRDVAITRFNVANLTNQQVEEKKAEIAAGMGGQGAINHVGFLREDIGRRLLEAFYSTSKRLDMDPLFLMSVAFGEGLNIAINKKLRADPNSPIDSYQDMGMDKFANEFGMLQHEGLLPPNFATRFVDTGEDVRNEKGAIIRVVDFRHVEDAIDALGAMLVHRERLLGTDLAKYGIVLTTVSPEERQFWTYVYYNAGSAPPADPRGTGLRNLEYSFALGYGTNIPRAPIASPNFSSLANAQRVVAEHRLFSWAGVVGEGN
jgi:RHS repeat-associated protein